MYLCISTRISLFLKYNIRYKEKRNVRIPVTQPHSTYALRSVSLDRWLDVGKVSLWPGSSLPIKWQRTTRRCSSKCTCPRIETRKFIGTIPIYGLLDRSRTRSLKRERDSLDENHLTLPAECFPTAAIWLAPAVCRLCHCNPSCKGHCTSLCRSLSRCKSGPLDSFWLPGPCAPDSLTRGTSCQMLSVSPCTSGSFD